MKTAFKLVGLLVFVVLVSSGCNTFPPASLGLPDPAIVDSDGDGLTDDQERSVYGTSPTLADSDSDGLTDYNESIVLLTSPLAFDTDSDGLRDGDEVLLYSTNPRNRDSDGDGVSDGFELIDGTAPLRADTDGDGLSDKFDPDPLDYNSVSVVTQVLCGEYAIIDGTIVLYKPLQSGNFFGGTLPGDLVVTSITYPDIVTVLPTYGAAFTAAHFGVIVASGTIMGFGYDSLGNPFMRLTNGIDYGINFLHVDEALDWFAGDSATIIADVYTASDGTSTLLRHAVNSTRCESVLLFP